MAQQPTMYGMPPAQQRRGVHPLLWVILVIAMLALAGVGWLLYQRSTTPQVTINGPQAETFASAIAEAKAMTSCKEMYVPGKVIDEKKALAGCMGPRNVISAGSFFNCADGRALFSVDAQSGAPAGWGFGGEKFHAVKGEIAADSGYSKAYGDCNG